MWRKRSKKDWLAIPLATVLTGIIVALIAVYAYAQNRIVRLDATTQCPVDLPPGGHVAWVIDASDRLSRIQANEIALEIRTERARMEVHDRISIFFIEAGRPADEQIVPAFSMCKPYDGTGANWVYENPALIRRNWARAFGGPLDALLDALHELPESRTSPILEGLAQIAQWPPFSGAATRELRLVSDLLQNVDGYTHYGQLVAPSERYLRRIDLDLHGVRVDVGYVVRHSGEGARWQTDAHCALWRGILTDAGAGVRPLICEWKIGVIAGEANRDQV